MKQIILLFILFYANIAIAIEISPYQIIEKISDKVEIRQYDKIILATANISDDEEGDSAFRSLFKFISGENNQKQKIKMTAPVFREEIAGNMNMSFVMPAKFNEKNIPQPNNPKIKINLIQNQKFIAIKFSGFASDNNFKENQEILEQIIKKKQINANLDLPIRAYYNRPWSLPFLKRNELLFKLY
jgi:hypothetical protein